MYAQATPRHIKDTPTCIAVKVMVVVVSTLLRFVPIGDSGK